jgi:hypothetical protein
MIELKNLQKIKNMEKGKYRFAHKHISKMEINNHEIGEYEEKSDNHEAYREGSTFERPHITMRSEKQRSLKNDSPTKHKQMSFSKVDSLKEMVNLFLSDEIKPHATEENDLLSNSASALSFVSNVSPTKKFTINKKGLIRSPCKEELKITEMINSEKAQINFNRQEDMRKA